MERRRNTILLFSFFLVISLDPPHEKHKRELKNMRLFWKMECWLSGHFKKLFEMLYIL
jgi:hypothetical protein